MKKHNFKSFSRVHTRTLLTLLCLLTLGLGQMWAYELNYPIFYFDNSSGTTWSNVMFFYYYHNHEEATQGFNLTNISNTKLYYGQATENRGDKCSGLVYGFMDAQCDASHWEWQSGNNWDSRWGWAVANLNHSGTSQTNLPYGSYLCTSSSSSNLSVSNLTSSDDGISKLKYDQTVNVVVNGSSTPATSPADIDINSHYWTSKNTVSSAGSSTAIRKNGSTITDKYGDAAYTATTTLTVGTLNSGYYFLGWYSAATGDTRISTDNPYVYYPREAKTWYARFESRHSVTVSAGANGTTSPSSGSTTTAGYYTESGNISATANTGYYFTGWTLPNSGVWAASGYNTSSNPIKINANADSKTISANFAQRYVLRGSINATGNPAGGMPGWDATSNSNLSVDGNVMTFTVTLTSAKTQYKCMIRDIKDNEYKGQTGSSEIGDNESWTLDGSNDVLFTTTAPGTYTFTYNVSNGSFKIIYPSTYTVTYGYGAGGSGVSATNGGYSIGSSSGYAVAGTDVVMTATAATGYHFTEWRTASAGGGSQISTSNPYTISSISANTTIYAVFAATNYTTANNLKEADGTANGQYNVTYDNTSIAHTSAPSRTGYTIEGYYKQAAWTNKIANTDLSLVTSSSYTKSGTNKWNQTSAPALYLKWQQTLTLAGNGAGSTNGSITTTYYSTSATGHTAATRTGYQLAGYYDATSGGNKIININGTLVSYSASVSDYLDTNGKWIYNGTPTLSAQWTANTYTIAFNANSGTGTMTSQTGVAYDSETTIKANEFEKTGYNFAGWATSSGGSVVRADGAVHGNLSSTQGATVTLFAKWTAKSYTVTLDVDEENKGTITGATTNQTVTYDAATTTVPNRPTAANGYALVGYYTDQAGEGLKVINGDGTWIASVTGYTDGSKNWVHDGDVTLYAYYQKAEITELTLAAAVVGTGETDSITVTPTIAPTPTGTTTICWEIQYSNGTALPSQPAGRTLSGNTYRFKAPGSSATYKVQCKLYTGSSCGGGTLLDTRSTTFQVAGEHTVTIQYQDADGNTIKSSTGITAKPLEWTDNFSAPDIVGYTFTKWVQGDGVTIDGADGSGEKTTNPIRIKATYAGTLTAVYTKKEMIYFNNTLGWDHVYVYFYSDANYWGNDRGTGAQYDYLINGTYPHQYHFWGEMTQIAGTNVWYFDYQAAAATIDPTHASDIDDYQVVAFTKDAQGYTDESNKGYEWFYNTKAARRTDFKHSLSMYVPETTKSESQNGTDYYNNGYWMNYPENTGYKLKVYEGTSSGATEMTYKSAYFPFTADKTLPASITMDLEAGKTYGFTIARADGSNYRYNGTFTNTGSQNIVTGVTNHTGVQTSAAGDYTFTLSSSAGTYSLGVKFPVAVNDWRIVYRDLAAWSGATHTASWCHPSAGISKNGSATDAKRDIVSFYWAYGSSPTLQTQQCTAVGTGSVTWGTPSSALDVSAYSSVLKEAGVYNFIFEQPAGGASISLVGVEPYTGNYYIRTDCAGGGKWDNFRDDPQHLMTYSEYTKDNWAYTHYYAHWVTTGTNVKFTIANDYSQCISDSLIGDYGTVVASIDGNGFLSSADANIRFMWNEATNKLSRAYIGGSGTITDRFLVLEGDTKMYDENGNSLTGEHQDHDKYGTKLGTDNQVIMHDDENFVYERTIKVNASARAKLTANYNTNIQYFYGSEGAFAEGTTTQLLGGTYSAENKYQMRIVYDFKTNRLVTAYVPSDTVTGSLAINADLMLVREHQEDGKQLVFKGDGAGLSAVKTVYGVMRFNRWTLNNKSTADGHAPLGDPKSAYERGLYWISFPFDVNLSDVFGFGTYGVDWIIEYYDGEGRAEKGYWIDSPSFWRYVTNRAGYVLEAGKGYVLALDLDRMKSDNTEFWANNIEQVELFFPSATNVGGISETTAHTTVHEHACTIDRTGLNGAGADINKNRTKADSHWNIIGVPSYANYGSTLTSDGSTTVTWRSDPTVAALPYLYEWNTVDNTYTVQSGSTYPFKAMHAYMVQYHGDLYWSLASATPVVSPIVARRTYAEKPQNVEFRLELQQNEKMIDQTFVKLSDDEEVSANFIFDEDLCKEYNASKANIYTFIENYIPAAGNTLPVSEQTTLVPVGVQIKTTGEYTFSMPDGTEGVGITFIDNETGVRTSLSALDYTVNLSAGTYDNRFVLEISPIKQTPTGVELLNGENGENGVRKVMIDGLLYIVKDGTMFDARGARLK